MKLDIQDSLTEPAYVFGTFLGMVLLALGLATLVLALSIGVREGTYLTQTQDLAIGVIGSLGVGIGVVIYAYAGRLRAVPDRWARRTGTVIGSVGLVFVLFSLSADTTASAPFLVRPFDKVILFVVAYGLIAAGWFLIQGARRVVGW